MEPETKPKKNKRVPATADGRPHFAKDFPRTPELDALVLAFEHGDYARVRTDAPKLAQSTDDPAVRAAATLLRDRLEADPLAKWLLGLTLALLLFMSVWWAVHGKAPASDHGAPRPPVTVERVK